MLKPVIAGVAMKKMSFGDLRLAPTGRTIHVKGQSAGKIDDLRGTAELFSVRSPEWEMTIAHNRWDNGHQDIVLEKRGTAPQRFDRFRSARRLGIHPVPAGGACFVELQQALLGENDHPTLRNVGLEQLSLAADCDVQVVLGRMGATVGTRSWVIGDTSSHGSRYCARFPCDATDVAVVAYVLTRIAPFHKQVRPAWFQQPA
jgi:hypothetical protein